VRQPSDSSHVEKEREAEARLNRFRASFSHVSSSYFRTHKSFPVGPVLIVLALFVGARVVWHWRDLIPGQGSTAAAQTGLMTSAQIDMIDGDTIRINGRDPHVRLVGFNTPETSGYRCEAERELGERATSRLRELIQQAVRIDYVRVTCACPPGTEGTDSCNYGRYCGSLGVDGRNVGDILIQEYLAEPYHCKAASCPRKKLWCQAGAL
jgi:endonuclease YncB( thermonuclease family)